MLTELLFDVVPRLLFAAFYKALTLLLLLSRKLCDVKVWRCGDTTGIVSLSQRFLAMDWLRFGEHPSADQKHNPGFGDSILKFLKSIRLHSLFGKKNVKLLRKSGE